MRTHELIEDPRFGTVTAICDGEEGVVEVSGPGIPTVSIRRGLKVAPKPGVPIGTRKAAHLTLSVNDRTLSLRPGRAKWLRRTYGARVRSGNTVLRLAPSAPCRSRLVRGDRVPYTFLRTRRRIGTLRTNASGTAPHSSAWQERSAPSAEEAALGYAMGTAFGIGRARSWEEAEDAVEGAELAASASEGVAAASASGSVVVGIVAVFRGIGRAVRQLIS